jgi:ribonuclease HI
MLTSANVGENRLPVCAARNYQTWETDFSKKVFFGCRLEGPKDKLTRKEQHRVSSAALQSRRIRYAGWQCFTDGSVEPQRRSAGASLLFRHNQPQPVARAHAPAGILASSLRAEAVGAIEGLKLTISRLTNLKKHRGKHRFGVVVITDSLSLISQLQSGPLARCMDHDAQTIWNLLFELTKLTVYASFQHVYSHCGIKKNEAVDGYADDAAKHLTTAEQQKQVPTKLSDFMAFARREQAEAWHGAQSTEEFRFNLVGQNPTCVNQTKSWERDDERLAAQIRSGECPLLGKNRHRWDSTTTTACRWCSPQLNPATSEGERERKRKRVEEGMDRHARVAASSTPTERPSLKAKTTGRERILAAPPRATRGPLSQRARDRWITQEEEEDDDEPIFLRTVLNHPQLFTKDLLDSVRRLNEQKRVSLVEPPAKRGPRSQRAREARYDEEVDDDPIFLHAVLSHPQNFSSDLVDSVRRLHVRHKVGNKPRRPPRSKKFGVVECPTCHRKFRNLKIHQAKALACRPTDYAPKRYAGQGNLAAPDAIDGAIIESMEHVLRDCPALAHIRPNELKREASAAEVRKASMTDVALCFVRKAIAFLDTRFVPECQRSKVAAAPGVSVATVQEASAINRGGQGDDVTLVALVSTVSAPSALPDVRQDDTQGVGFSGDWRWRSANMSKVPGVINAAHRKLDRTGVVCTCSPAAGEQNAEEKDALKSR